MKIGLSLSGGAARGLAHIGVIEVLEDQYGSDNRGGLCRWSNRG
jgi:hypothetical protein